MITEILIILLIIIVILVFLLFFKTWHLHILFKNHDLDYILSVTIIFLFIQIEISEINSNPTIGISIKLFSKVKQLHSTKIESNTETDELPEEKTEQNTNTNTKDYTKIKKISQLLLDSKYELYHIIQLITGMIKFNYSKINMDLGLGDNNLTIKICNLIWTISAPLYPLNFHLLLTPHINETIIKTDCDINFNIKLVNVLKIGIIIIKNKKLIMVIKTILGKE
ncbi:DUF2953 domain-containing protein [Methanosphaera sp. ISO3-F5]|uniref:DUF2953 domain-containing protein n=1 Tax=Methanosphaera sp. ISO3-F5 TaxID=1452353 RepID=UPI002B25F3ED|nr:DUF2953 domain-containing protein [Methanosphaera sp. ISO3-F5]WQH63212.1 DUF2953 domain-containing protein [Methanosphaera sp. ISO3-F5]